MERGWNDLGISNNERVKFLDPTVDGLYVSSSINTGPASLSLSHEVITEVLANSFHQWFLHTARTYVVGLFCCCSEFTLGVFSSAAFLLSGGFLAFFFLSRLGG